MAQSAQQQSSAVGGVTGTGASAAAGGGHTHTLNGGATTGVGVPSSVIAVQMGDNVESEDDDDEEEDGGAEEILEESPCGR